MRTKNQWDWTDPVSSLGPIVARLRAGDAVGELALQKPNTTRNATVVAGSNGAELCCISRSDYRRILADVSEDIVFQAKLLHTKAHQIAQGLMDHTHEQKTDLMLNLVRHVSLFQQMDLDVRHSICSQLVYRVLRPGQHLMDEDAQSEHFYVILSGEIRLMARAHNAIDVHEVAVRRAGSVCGEIEMLLPRIICPGMIINRVVWGTATKETRVVVLSKSGFLGLWPHLESFVARVRLITSTPIMEDYDMTTNDPSLDMLRRLACLYTCGKQVRFTKADVIGRRHQALLDLYCIESGAVDLTTPVHGKDREVVSIPVTTIGTKAMFGFQQHLHHGLVASSSVVHAVAFHRSQVKHFCARSGIHALRSYYQRRINFCIEHTGELDAVKEDSLLRLRSPASKRRTEMTFGFHPHAINIPPPISKAGGKQSDKVHQISVPARPLSVQGRRTEAHYGKWIARMRHQVAVKEHRTLLISQAPEPSSRKPVTRRPQSAAQSRPVKLRKRNTVSMSKKSILAPRMRPMSAGPRVSSTAGSQSRHMKLSNQLLRGISTKYRGQVKSPQLMQQKKALGTMSRLLQQKHCRQLLRQKRSNADRRIEYLLMRGKQNITASNNTSQQSRARAEHGTGFASANQLASDLNNLSLNMSYAAKEARTMAEQGPAMPTER